MKLFKSFLLEYLTDEQRAHYSQYKMTDKARADTDHYFGKDNDEKEGTVSGVHQDKSEVHQKIERHLGKEISHAEYRAGVVKGADPKYPDRSLRYSKVLPADLHSEYVKDPSREGARSISDVGELRTSTHRGTEVAGQTNSAPTETHPTGHSWPSSCKNLVGGINKHYIPHEIEHGSVVHFVHDKDGKEIYRATLHPYHNDEGHVMYKVDAHYGMQHPEFKASAERAAKELSHKGGGGLYKVNDKVYNDSDVYNIVHPETSADELHKIYHDARKSHSGDSIIGQLAVHKNLGDHTIEDMIVKGDHRSALQSPNLKAHHLDKIIDHAPNYSLSGVLRHPVANEGHSVKLYNRALGDTTMSFDVLHGAHTLHRDVLDNMHKSDSLSRAIGDAPGVKGEHLEKLLSHNNDRIRDRAIQNPNATEKHISDYLSNSPHDFYNVTEHPKLNGHHIRDMVNEHPFMLHQAAYHSKAPADVLDRAIAEGKPDDDLHVAVADNMAATKGHIAKVIAGGNTRAIRTAINHAHNGKKISANSIHDILSHEDHGVRSAAFGKLKLNDDHIDHVANLGSTEDVANLLHSPNAKNIKDGHLTSIIPRMEHPSELFGNEDVKGKLKPHHLEAIVNNAKGFGSTSALTGAVEHPSANEHTLKAAISHPKLNYASAHAAANHPAFKPEHIDHWLENGHNRNTRAVGDGILSGPHTTATHLDKAYESGHTGLMGAALAHPKASEEMIHKGINHPDYEIASSVAENPNLKPHHVAALKNHPDEDVRELAHDIK